MHWQMWHLFTRGRLARHTDLCLAALVAPVLINCGLGCEHLLVVLPALYNLYTAYSCEVWPSGPVVFLVSVVPVSKMTSGWGMSSEGAELHSIRYNCSNIALAFLKWFGLWHGMYMKAQSEQQSLQAGTEAFAR